MAAERQIVVARRDLLSAAVVDISGSVKANDQKASAALIVHGLLFAGVVTIVSRLGPVYEHAKTWQRITGTVPLAIALGAFLISIWYLLRALRPYHDEELDQKLKSKYKRVFFPLPKDLDQPDPLSAWRECLDQLDFEDTLDTLTAEVLKLGAILRWESSKTGSGYLWLGAEVAAGAAFFVTAAGVAMSQAM